MRKKVVLTFVLALCLCCSYVFSGCFWGGGDDLSTRFGEFGYKGIYLTKFSSKNIQPSEAKEILSQNINNMSRLRTLAATEIPKPGQNLIEFVLSEYSGCQIVTKFYIDNSNEQSSKTDYLIGTDLKTMVTENKFSPFSQLVAKNIICFPELIDAMEGLNKDFQQSNTTLIAPFSTVFSYHTDSEGRLVIHSRDFSEIPSSVGGGIAASYRQDTEMLYDSQNKLIKWQTSLGLYSAAPQGTMRQGYILEVEFIWEQKK